MDDSVLIPPTIRQRKGKHRCENTYIQQCLCVYMPDSRGPCQVNLNSSEVSSPPVPQCLALGLQMLPV